MLSEILIVSEDPSMLAKVSRCYISVAKGASVKAVMASDFQASFLKRSMLVVVDIRHLSVLRKILAACDMLQITTVTFSNHNLSNVEQSVRALANHTSIRQLKELHAHQPKPSVSQIRVAWIQIILLNEK